MMPPPMMTMDFFSDCGMLGCAVGHALGDKTAGRNEFWFDDVVKREEEDRTRYLTSDYERPGMVDLKKDKKELS